MADHDELVARLDKQWMLLGNKLDFDAAAIIRSLQAQLETATTDYLKVVRDLHDERARNSTMFGLRIAAELRADSAESALAKRFEALQVLVELKQMKRKIEAGTAEVSMCDYYRANKETAWVNAEAAIRTLAPEETAAPLCPVCFKDTPIGNCVLDIPGNMENSDQNSVVGAESALADWVGDFLWHWEQSGVLHGDAAKAVISVVRDSLDDDQICQLPRITAQALIRSLENRQD